MKPKRVRPARPQRRYPAFFPGKRFAPRDDGPIDPPRIEESTRQRLDDFDAAPNAPAIVPPGTNYRLPLRAESRQAERVPVIFEIAPAARTVAASNQCT